MKGLILTFLIILSSIKMNSQNDTLIYVGDPMCSWCYGFSPELDQIKAAFPNTHFKMIMGGLRVGGTETLGDLSEFLKEHWTEIHTMTGQEFKYDILNQTSLLYDTEPACRAVIVASELKPEIKYDFFKAVQESFYYHNDIPGATETYAKIAVRFGINKSTFVKQFEDAKAKTDTQAEFELAQAMGVRGFPSLMVKIDGKVYFVSNGFQKAGRIITVLREKGLK